MKKFDHINIVKFIELMTTKRSLYIITEMCMDGDLKKLLIRKKLTEQEVIQFCRDNMANFKAPKTVVFGELPKTSTGKIQKFMLRDRAKEL